MKAWFNDIAHNSLFLYGGNKGDYLVWRFIK